jgi:hypothetical protein
MDAFPVGLPADLASDTPRFAFGLPDGNSLIGTMTFKPDDSTQPVTATGFASNCFTGVVLPPDTIYYSLEMRVDQQGLTAYAVVYYQPPTGQGAGLFCHEPQKVGTVALLEAGCSAATCGPDPLDTVASAVNTFDGDLVQAAKDGKWGDVYSLSSESITGQYTTPDAFTAAMQQQVRAVGQITQIAPLSAAPVVQIDPTGQAYCAVTQTVTLNTGSSVSTPSVTTYFVLEGGQWRFWFSA